jgi:hypothetical protein
MASSSSRSEGIVVMEVGDVAPALQERLGPAATVGLLALFATARQKWTVDVTTAAVERFERRLGEEISAVRLEIAGLREELRTNNASLREELRTSNASLRQELRDGDAALRQDMSELKFDLLKWSFVFWVGQTFATAAVFATMFQLMNR